MSLFDTETWRERMDERWFETGVAMAENGDVDLVSIEDNLVTAHVTGSVGDLYVVELRAPIGEGFCSCPGFEKFGACKHQAAVVTAANAADLGKVNGRMARLREGLELDNRDALVARILELARKHPLILTALEDGESFAPEPTTYSFWNYFFDPIVDEAFAPLEDGTLEVADTATSFGEVEDRIAALEIAVSDLRNGGIGHNGSPEHLDEGPPLSDIQLRQISTIAAVLKVEMQKEQPNGIIIAQNGRKLRDFGQWLAKKLDVASDETVKLTTKAAFASAAIAVAANWERLAECLAAVVRSLVAWAAS